MEPDRGFIWSHYSFLGLGFVGEQPHRCTLIIAEGGRKLQPKCRVLLISR